MHQSSPDGLAFKIQLALLLGDPEIFNTVLLVLLNSDHPETRMNVVEFHLIGHWQFSIRKGGII
jgi:hypothetical protein